MKEVALTVLSFGAGRFISTKFNLKRNDNNNFRKSKSNTK